MAKYLAFHTFPPNGFTADQCRQLGEAGQRDPVVHGERSYINLSEGKGACVLEAPDRETVARWFDKMHMPYDSIVEVEIEGDRGRMSELQAHVPVH